MSGAQLNDAVIPPHNGIRLPLHRAVGPSSPPLADLLRQDQLRVDHIHRGLSGDDRASKAAVKEPVRFGEQELHHQPVIQVAIGSESKSSARRPAATGGGGGLPGVVQTVVLDTASDVPWLQCAPCPAPRCHAQTADAVYDPARSGTYLAVPCSHPSCTQLGLYAGGCASNQQCQYRVTYSDNSSSSGTYGFDLLTFDDAGNSIPNFRFGCSHAEQRGTGTAASFGNGTAGIMALGGGPESLASQAAEAYGRGFSYCIPAAESSSPGFFVLGAPPPSAASSSMYVQTSLLTYDKRVRPTFYRVLLRGIAVDGRELNVTPSAFAAGAVLDSRTVVTRLPPTVYRALREAFASRMAAYAAAPPKGGLDTCYDLSRAPGTVAPPRIALVFDRGAAVELDPSAVLLDDCLAFTANVDDRMPGIIGSLQQQTMEVLYHVGAGTVGFRRGAC